MYYYLIVAVFLLNIESSLAACISGVSSPHSSCLSNSGSLVSVVSTADTDVLPRHNYWRSSSQLSSTAQPSTSLTSLQWNADLATTAQQWASNCNYEHDAYTARNVPSMSWTYVGQNIAASSNVMSYSDVIDLWASEKANWKYGVGSTNGLTVGHYTQLIWNTTLYVGCGGANCSPLTNGGTTTYFYVCNYGPAGNTMGSNYAYPYYSTESSSSGSSSSGSSSSGSSSSGSSSSGSSSSGTATSSSIVSSGNSITIKSTEATRLRFGVLSILLFTAAAYF